jgi:hypothetical protein
MTIVSTDACTSAAASAHDGMNDAQDRIMPNVDERK